MVWLRLQAHKYIHTHRISLSWQSICSITQWPHHLLFVVVVFIFILANCCIALAVTHQVNYVHFLSVEVVIFPATGSFGAESPALGDPMSHAARLPRNTPIFCALPVKLLFYNHAELVLPLL